MLHWFAKRLNELHKEDRKGEKGFTLIELLVVVIIIGILAAIAIPAFLGQRTRAQDATAQSLVRSAASDMESCAAANQGSYANCNAAALQPGDPNITFVNGANTALAANDAVGISGLAANSYTLDSTSVSGTVYIYTNNAGAVTRTTTNPAGTW